MNVDDIKAKAEHYDLKGKAEKAEAGAKKAAEVAKEAAKVAKEATIRASERAGEVTYKHRSQIEAQIDKAESAVNRKVSGKRAPMVHKVRGLVGTGLDKISSQRPAAKAARAAGDVPPTTTD